MSHSHPCARFAVALLAIATTLVLFLGLTGCSSCSQITPTPEPTTTPTPTTTPEPTASPEPEPVEKIALRVYFVRGECLGVASHEVTSTVAVARAALEELLGQPTSEEADAGLVTLIPAGTRLLGISISDGVATVDLSSEFESGGGSLSMLLRISQVVFTLTQFNTVDSVAFKIDGIPVESIGGEGIMVSPPVNRLSFMGNVAPAILVESPAPWQTVGETMRVTGVSNTFEATFLYEVVDPRGLIVAEGFTTSTGGMGEWGAFDFTIDYEISYSGVGSLVVFEQSAKDGSRINIVEIPVRMVKGQ